MNLYLSYALTAVLFLVPIRLVCTNRLPPTLFYVYFAILSLVAIILPVIFHFSLFLQRGVLYFYFLEKPEDGLLKDPENNYGLTNTRNFYVKNGNVTLGVWHVLPEFYQNSPNRSNDDLEESLSRGEPVILYVHGNVGSRARSDRLRLYKVLQKLNYHVISFDFRCFGDSTFSTPHEEAVVSDCLTMAHWVLERSAHSPVFFYGHSLGTGMVTHLAALLKKEGFEPRGVILEAPFDNMPSEIRVHPFGRIFRVFPWYNALFSEPYYNNGEKFDSANHILKFSSPILILHAEDDGTIPCILGEKLYEHGKRMRSKTSGPISIHIYDAQHGYGHTELTTAPETAVIIRDFIERYKNNSFQV